MTGKTAVKDATVAIANRGEIAIRIAATCRRLGAVPALLLGEPDLTGLAARTVNSVERVGEAGSELDPERVVAAAKRAGADYLHPGYGFLSERADLAETCERAGIRFVGPSAATLRLCGDKLETRAAAERAGVPVLAASGPLGGDPDGWLAEGRRIGYPLLVKPAGAGGGRGLRLVEEEGHLVDAVAASRREGTAAGQAPVVYLERALIAPRHVEVQVAAAGERVVALGDRDCSLQRRHQKVIEEAPAPNLSDETRANLHDYARRIGREVGLENIATCEFLLGQGDEIAFLEVNPRIQVEHPVTELVTGVDLVEWQLRIASGHPPTMTDAPTPRGHAVEARVYAEEPAAAFRPGPGRLGTVAWPAGPGVRVDAGYASGDTVPHAYDAMLAKVIAHGPTREAAIVTLREALLGTVVAGVPTNIAWLLDLLESEAFRSGEMSTQTTTAVPPEPPEPGIAAVAALAAMLDAEPAGDGSAWSRLGPWRMGGPAPVTLHGDGWERTLEPKRVGGGWEIVDRETGETARWSHGAEGVLEIDFGGEVARAAVAERQDGVEVSAGGGRWLVRRGPVPVLAPGQRAMASNGQVVAPMPGTIVSVAVREGDAVAKGDPLLALYAMKMELTVEAPDDGVVEAIACAEGDLVAADQVLVTLRWGNANDVRR
jgi:acetyl/propionyl-CoA carboxylase alpha subunit